jgi:hypothetical protein
MNTTGRSTPEPDESPDRPEEPTSEDTGREDTRPAEGQAAGASGMGQADPYGQSPHSPYGTRSPDPQNPYDSYDPNAYEQPGYGQPGYGQGQGQGGYDPGAYDQSGYGTSPYGTQYPQGQYPPDQYGGYGQMAPAQYGMAPPNAPKATVALVLGIVGVVLCPLTGPAAIIVGYQAKRQIESEPGRYGGAGLATAGLVLGVVGTVFLVGLVLLLLAVMAGGFATY